MTDLIPFPERRERDLKRRYGITQKQYQAMHDKQNGLCACCGSTCPSGKNLSVDHDHLTGQVRGLLCRPCNLGIGKLGDTAGALARALDYLRRGPVQEVIG